MNDGIFEVNMGLSYTRVISTGVTVLLLPSEMFMSLLPVLSTSQHTLKFWSFLHKQDRLYNQMQLFLWRFSKLALWLCGVAT